VKDLVDLVLAEQVGTPHAGRLMEALDSIFSARGTHSIPDSIPRPPTAWSMAYRRIAEETGLTADTGTDALKAAHMRVAAFLQPILDRTTAPNSAWNPSSREWSCGS
jgi:hypothetical protein